MKFVNALREVNVTVHRATKEFSVSGKSYPARSFVVFTNQAFRPHVMDMFEPQDHPNVIAYPGAPPTRPYDNAGWTLAFQMGVQFDRILEGVHRTVREGDRLERQAAGRHRTLVRHRARLSRSIARRTTPSSRSIACSKAGRAVGDEQSGLRHHRRLGRP